ncbi:unnamed protein product [Cochlearia groenlandica]
MMVVQNTGVDYIKPKMRQKRDEAYQSYGRDNIMGLKVVFHGSNGTEKQEAESRDRETISKGRKIDKFSEET